MGDEHLTWQMKKTKGTMRGKILGVVIFVLAFPSYLLWGGQEVMPFRKVAVLGFLTIRPQAERERMVEGLFGGYFFRAGEVSPRARSEVMTVFCRKLLGLGRCEVIPLDRSAAAVAGRGPIAFRQDPLGEAVRLGKQLDVHAVVIGGVYRFERRQGSALGVERPASVAFDAHLIRIDDKKVIWSGRFDETQRSLSENLLKASTFIKSGGHWVTAEKLTAIGIESILRTFPLLTP